MEIKIGAVFTRLTVILESQRKKYFVCECSCGNQKEIRQDHLLSGKTLSCGCLRNEKASQRTPQLHKSNIKHGKCRSKVHSIWTGMLQRCDNPKNKFFSYYGGREIKVCDQWHDFRNFYADMGDPPTGLTIDRKDNNGNYEKSNCRWASRAEQQNNRNVCRSITLDGETKTIAEWSRETGVHYNTIRERLSKGLDPESALSLKKNQNLSGLFLGAKISQEKRLARTHCGNGHEYTPENTYQTKKQRYCRACGREKEARRRDKLKILSTIKNDLQVGH